MEDNKCELQWIKNLILFLFIIILRMIDLITTIIGLILELEEINILWRFLYNFPLIFIGVQILLLTIIGCCLLLRENIKDIKLCTVAYVFFIISNLIIIFNNITWLFIIIL